MEHFATRLVALRKDKGWTRRSLAHKSGLNEHHLSKVERGERMRLEADTVIKLARALGVSADYLLGMDEDQHDRLPACQEVPA